jgi:hypothetical protein
MYLTLIIVTPESYARSVLEHSRTTSVNSLYQGQNYTQLAEFLNLPYQKYRPSHVQDTRPPQIVEFTPAETRAESECFAWLYELDKRIPMRVPLQGVDSLATMPNSSTRGSILFLRGLPTSEWLNSLGAMFKIDPEFYYRHLSFMSAEIEARSPWDLILPSHQSFIFQTTVTSVGYQPASNGVDVVSKRILAERAMQTYFQTLKRTDGWSITNSVVRNCSIHDEQEFSVDQAITICVTKAENEVGDGRWIGRLVFIAC